MQRLFSIAFLTLSIWLVLPPGSVLAQGTTAFTYQGQLRDGGTNANGTYNLTFTLFDSPTESTNRLGNPITLSPTLANGLFTVNLDFGNVFDGNARWLDIAVQSGTNAPEELLPRVQILPSPYAVYAGAAKSLSDGNWTMGVGNYGPIQNGLLVFNNGTVVMAMSTNGSYAPSLVPIPKFQAFTANGTFVVPPGINKIKVEAWGGGGGGGAYGSLTINSATYVAGGGGGGAGAYAVNNLDVSPGDNYTVTIGNGGSAGGGSGGTSSFGSLLIAGGGSGGGSGSVVNQNNNPVYYPGNGGSGGTSTNSDPYFENANGQGGNMNTGGGQLGGNGASAVRGGAGGWGNGGGANGQSPGGGGGGGGTVGTPSGGSGGHGMVIVYY